MIAFLEGVLNDKAFTNIDQGLRKAIEELHQHKSNQLNSITSFNMNLSSAESEIIFYAKEEDGEIQVIKTQAGKCVVVGEKEFGAWGNSRERRKYLDALDSLQNKKLVKHEEGILYCLTSRGFEISDALESPSRQDFDQSQNTQLNPKLEQSPTHVTYNDLRGANIGNFAEIVQSGGRQETTQHIYAPEQDFDKLLADYKRFFNNLQQKYPTPLAESNLKTIIDVELQEIQHTQPQRWQNFLNLKHLWNGGKKATLKMGEHFTEENLWGKMAIAFLEGITEDTD